MRKASFGMIYGAWCVVAAAVIGFWSFVGYVAWHFISKFW
jgi:hypothetical protein